MRLAISTGGGDAPGLNAVIRAAVLSAIHRGWEVFGIRRGYYGLLGEDEVIPLTKESVRGIAHMGGTILRTTNRGNPFEFPVLQSDGSYAMVDRSDEVHASSPPMPRRAVASPAAWVAASPPSEPKRRTTSTAAPTMRRTSSCWRDGKRSST